MFKSENSRAFTLVELLIVIAIIGLLASVIMVALSSARVRARDAKRLSEVQQTAKALELYFNQCNAYPQLPTATINFRLNSTLALFSGTVASCGNSQGVSGNGGIGSSASGEVFISRLPTAPTPPDNGSLPVGSRCSESNTATNSQTWNDYSYISFTPDQYWLYFCIGTDVGGYSAGRYVRTEKGMIKYTNNLYP
jgi:prepilin-type N-terminal cleavage/methylation domain-containing protein